MSLVKATRKKLCKTQREFAIWCNQKFGWDIDNTRVSKFENRAIGTPMTLRRECMKIMLDTDNVEDWV